MEMRVLAPKPIITNKLCYLRLGHLEENSTKCWEWYIDAQLICVMAVEVQCLLRAAFK